MKKTHKMILSGLALASILSPLSAVMLSCQNIEKSKDGVDINKFVTTKIFNGLLEQTKGRWAGNKSNITNYNSETFAIDQEQLTNKNLKRLYPLDADVKEDKNYGSLHAYEYIKQQVINLGYTDHTPEFSYPNQSVISVSKDESTSKEVATWTLGQDTSESQLSDKTWIVYNNSLEQRNRYHDLMKKDGLVSQGFLFHTSKTYNNLGTNLIVTVNPSSKNFEAGTEPKDFYIASHYDSTAQGPNKSSWGATDNATSVAVNLALLKYYSDEKNREDLGVRLHFVFVDAEELGKLGSYAFVKQFLSSSDNNKNSMKDNSVGMINLDTVAGGDVLYVHSPDAKMFYSNTDSTIRDQLHAISRAKSLLANRPDYLLEIHPYYTAGEYKPGQTGYWSDHAPFCTEVVIPVAYIEATNFAIKSNYGSFDGYSQVTNPKAWITKDGKNVELVKSKLNGSIVDVYDLPEGIKREDMVVAGNIWHSDLDRLDWVQANIGNKLYEQMNVVYELLIDYFKIISVKDNEGKVVNLLI
ncbi:M28 family metallopeptidase [Mycoplasma sp. 3341]|uniref:M28 family metallopeptidase n=1 Tax=Mycoplasma sp. 3341 TaxID=3447506 RepID=UPI003F65A4F9